MPQPLKSRSRWIITGNAIAEAVQWALLSAFDFFGQKCRFSARKRLFLADFQPPRGAFRPQIPVFDRFWIFFWFFIVLILFCTSTDHLGRAKTSKFEKSSFGGFCGFLAPIWINVRWPWPGRFSSWMAQTERPASPICLICSANSMRLDPV